MKIKLARQGNFILTLLLIHFVFFGFLSNIFPKVSMTIPGANQALAENVVFLYRLMFYPIPFLSVPFLPSLLVLVIIIFIVGIILLIFTKKSIPSITLLGISIVLFILSVFFAFTGSMNVGITLNFYSVILLFVIVFIMVFRERNYEYGIRNSIWLVPFIIVESWIWYFFIYEFNLLIIPIYFIRIESYITILSLLGINLLAAILAALAKQKYIQFFKKYKTIVVT
ncbi:MAG: hypothetical protein ACFFCG_04910 [Promethearchaeota archaeon]